MWTLPIPPRDGSSDDLVTAFKRSRPGTDAYTLNSSETTAIDALYDRYDELNGRRHPDLAVPGFEEVLTQAIIRAYNETYPGGRIFELRNRLKLAAERCPFCGFAEISDLDHHLPVSEFGALAVYRRNLVPSCGPCNNKKRTAGRGNSAEELIHAYFDQIPNEKFFVATARLAQGALVVTLRVERSQSMSVELYERLKFQVERLDLSRRYRAAVNTLLLEQEAGFELAFGQGDPERLSAFLDLSAEKYAMRFGLNDWRTALLTSLAAESSFCAGGFRQALGAAGRASTNGP